MSKKETNNPMQECPELFEFKTKLLHLCEQYKINVTGVFHASKTNHQMTVHCWEFPVKTEEAVSALLKCNNKIAQELTCIFEPELPFWESNSKEESNAKH